MTKPINSYLRVESKTLRAFWAIALAAVVSFGCKNPAPSPNANPVAFQLTAAGLKNSSGVAVCESDTGGKVLITGVPLADNTCEMGTTKDSSGKTIPDTTKVFQIPSGATVTLTAVPRTATDKLDHWEGAVSGSALVVTLTVSGPTNVTALFCGLIK